MKNDIKTVLPSGENKDGFPMKIYELNSDSQEVLLFVGGSGDELDSLDLVIPHLKENKFRKNIVVFSYSHVAHKKSYKMKQLILDLEAVLDELIKINREFKIILIPTSLGAFPACWTLATSKHTSNIERVVFFDPADYNLLDNYQSVNKEYTWGGGGNYNPSKDVVSDLLIGFEAEMKIDVVHLTLRNYAKDGYYDKEYKDRGADHKDGYPRLNTKMVKGFYKKLSNKCRGKYVELGGIPHAFKRDGDLEKNAKAMAKFFLEFV